MPDMPDWQHAQQYLAAVDPIMAGLIQRFGACTLQAKDPFHTFCASIIGQQISVKAASAVQQKVRHQLGLDDLFKPNDFLRHSDEALRACGLSRQKVKYLKAFDHAIQNGLVLTDLALLPNEAAIEILDALPGVGRWTAEMFLMFALAREDIFSLGDLGLRRVINQLYGNRDDQQATALAETWKPYRSIACWYLWRVTDGDDLSWA
jgi:DNA-3-methyladenine glycosylase II